MDQPYKVVFVGAAHKDLKQLPEAARKKVLISIEDLVKNPRPKGAESIKTCKGFYRIRCGNYRIVYEITDSELTVLIVAIGDRKVIYSLFERRMN